MNNRKLLETKLESNPSLAARNPDLARELAAKVTKPDACRTLDSEPSPQETGSGRVASCPDSKPRSSQGDTRIVVTIVGHLKRLMDDDNFCGGAKPLRDLISREIGIDDGDARIKFQYGQVKTCGQQFTTVTIETTL